MRTRTPCIALSAHVATAMQRRRTPRYPSLVKIGYRPEPWHQRGCNSEPEVTKGLVVGLPDTRDWSRHEARHDTI